LAAALTRVMRAAVPIPSLYIYIYIYIASVLQSAVGGSVVGVVGPL